MKIFLVLLLAGYVSASLKEDFEKASSDAVRAFKRGLEQAPPLHLALGVESTEEMQRFERGVKEELEKHIRAAFERTFQKVLDALKAGKKVPPEAVKSLVELMNKMEDLEIMDHELEGFKEQIDDHLKKILEKLGILDEDSFSHVNPMYSMFEDLSFRNFFIRMKEMILEKMDVTNLKHGLSKALGQVSQSLCQWLTNKGQEKVMNFFERVLEAEESEVDKRSLSDELQDKLQDYMADVNQNVMHLQSKLEPFQKWVHTVVARSLALASDNLEEVRTITKDAIQKM